MEGEGGLEGLAGGYGGGRPWKPQIRETRQIRRPTPARLWPSDGVRGLRASEVRVGGHLAHGAAIYDVFFTL